MEPIASGSVRIAGEDVSDVDPADRGLSMVFQNYALYPHMTVEQNMAYGLKIRKLPKTEIRRRVNEAADILEIGD